MPADFDDWKSFAELTAVGKAFLLNMEYDQTNGRVMNSFVKKIKDAIGTEWSKLPATDKSPKTAMSTLNAIMIEDGNKHRDTGKNGYLCKGDAVKQVFPVCKVIDAGSLLRWNVGWIDRNALRRRLGATDLKREGLLRYLHDKPFPPDYARPKKHKLGSRKGIVWVAPKSDFDGVMSSVKTLGSLEAAQRARDILGLGHFRRNQSLVEIVYPPTLSEKLALCAPLFVDGDNEFFRSYTGSPDGWGRTRVLDKQSSIGLPEAIHWEIPFTPEGDYVLRFLGKLNATKPIFGG